MAEPNVVEMEEHTRQQFESLVLSHFGPQILTNTKVYLACAMQTSLICDQPTSTILVGPSSSGKTLASRFIDAVALRNRFYRTDDFTPAAFVSQIANKSEKQLRKVDMLPKIRNKCMITPELAPLFKDDRKQMLKNFGIITRVMDGEGYWRDSGTHGGRGYTGDYNFAWIGGTSPALEKPLCIVEIERHDGHPATTLEAAGGLALIGDEPVQACSEERAEFGPTPIVTVEKALGHRPEEKLLREILGLVSRGVPLDPQAVVHRLPVGPNQGIEGTLPYGGVGIPHSLDDRIASVWETLATAGQSRRMIHSDLLEAPSGAHPVSLSAPGSPS